MTHAETQRNYDRLSHFYDLFAGSEKRFTDVCIGLLDLQPGERVLEIGCGTGYGLTCFSSAGTHVIGLDLSAGMLTQARRAGSRSGVPPAQLCQGDAICIPFRSNSFKVVFLSFTLELFPECEKQLLLAECHRILRGDGELGVVSLTLENTCTVGLYEWFHNRWPQVIDCHPIDVQKDLIKAGYVVREAKRMLMWGLPVEIIVSHKEQQR